MQGMPTLVTSAWSGAWIRERKNREPFSGELNNAHASRYWTQFTSAHCTTNSDSRMESNGTSIDLRGAFDRGLQARIFAARTPIGKRNWRVRSWCQVHGTIQCGPDMSTSKSKMPQTSRAHLSASEKAPARLDASIQHGAPGGSYRKANGPGQGTLYSPMAPATPEGGNSSESTHAIRHVPGTCDLCEGEESVLHNGCARAEP